MVWVQVPGSVTQQKMTLLKSFHKSPSRITFLQEEEAPALKRSNRNLIRLCGSGRQEAKNNQLTLIASEDTS